LAWPNTYQQTIAMSSYLLIYGRPHYHVVTREKKDNICIFQVTYAFTDHARPPDDGKLREIKSEMNWLTVGAEHLLPKPGEWRYPPIPLSVIYT